VCSLAVACSEDSVPIAPVETPVQISESFSGSITVNGAATHTFTTERAGQAAATLTSLAPDNTAVVSFTLGTWNGSYCQITLAKDDATTSSSLVGTASAGSFCVRISDVGRLTAPTDYEITVQHY
jgi:hypothetical protein